MLMRKLFHTDHDQITEDQKVNMWKIMAKHSNVSGFQETPRHRLLHSGAPTN